jgi:alpha/beta superfamily hydrolase
MVCCKRPGLFCALALLLAPTLGTAGTPDDPYATLREAYALRSGDNAGLAYAEDASYIEVYAGSDPRVIHGRAAISQHFATLFAQLGGAAVDLDLNFRRIHAAADATGRSDTGLYRLRVLDRATREAQTYYGYFATRVAQGRLAFDVSREATEAQFEAASGPLMFPDDADPLAQGFHDRLVGEYLDEAGCAVLITRSRWRLYALDDCSGAWRTLQRRSGLEWWHADRVVPIPDADRPEATLNFVPAGTESGDIIALLRTRSDGTVQRLLRAERFRTERVTWSGPAGRMAGTLYLPATAAVSAPAYVLLHGSGPQDRHGYASYIQLMAVQLARQGVIALSYDKRGSGDSEGAGDRASFADLAADASAALAWLRARSEVDARRSGFAGSSQAGWVAAKAVAAEALPARVLLLGAAGAAMNVERQNLFQTRRQLECERVAPRVIAALLSQQRAFYAVRRDPGRKVEFQRSSIAARAAIRSVPRLADWIFPDPHARPATGTPNWPWFTVLETEFDPLPIWQEYAGTIYAAFGSRDESTPAPAALANLAGLPRVRARRFVGAQHLGLLATDDCATDLSVTARFHPRWWPEFVAAARDR